MTNWFGRRVYHLSSTLTYDNLSGGETISEGTPTELTVHFVRTSQNWDFAKEGYLEKGDAVLIAHYSAGVKKEDIIITDGNTLEMTSIDGDATTISITTPAHGLSIGDEIMIFGTTNYDGVYTIATVPSTTTLTIADTTHNKAAETAGQLVKQYNKFTIKEAYDVAGVFDNEGGDTDFTYTRCNLFLKDES